MVDASSLLRPTPDQVSAWRAEKAKCEVVLREHGARLAAITQLLAGAEALGATASSPVVAATNGATPPAADNFMGTVVKLANEASAPIPKARLKAQLAVLGFPKKQLGTYFYSAVGRLTKAGRISVTNDGSVWRGTR